MRACASGPPWMLITTGRLPLKPWRAVDQAGDFESVKALPGDDFLRLESAGVHRTDRFRPLRQLAGGGCNT